MDVLDFLNSILTNKLLVPPIKIVVIILFSILFIRMGRYSTAGLKKIIHKKNHFDNQETERRANTLGENHRLSL